MDLVAEAALGAVLAAFAAGSHLQIGFNDGAFNFDFKVAAGRSGAASVLGWIALATGLLGIGLYASEHTPAGAGAASGPAGSAEYPNFPGLLRRLTKSSTDVWLGGVCGGLGERTPFPSWVWRMVFLLLLCCYGTGVLLYAALWICLPEPHQQEIEEPPTPGGTAARAAQ